MSEQLERHIVDLGQQIDDLRSILREWTDCDDMGCACCETTNEDGEKEKYVCLSCRTREILGE